jgi:ABC-type multidrug transport system ATPase subunit
VQAAIEARAVTSRTRAGEVTVRDISLTIGQGELVAIIGGAGSGKTTLLEALSGERAPTSGTIARHPDEPAGYVPAGDSIDPSLPLAHALGYATALLGVGDLSGDAVGAALDLVGLAAEASVPVGALNPGQRKCAEIAAELLAAPAALFLDEPTAALDPAQATQVLRLLRGVCGTGITVLLTTASPLDAARCDKVAVLATGGHLAFFGTPAAARGYFGADSLEEIYERLAGLGDPAVAWSRRFFYAPPTAAGTAPVPAPPRACGPALLIPDQGGPHSAGRPTPRFAPGLDCADWNAPDAGYDSDAGLEYARALRAAAPGAAGQEYGRDPEPDEESEGGFPGPAGAVAAGRAGSPGHPAKSPGPARQLPVLVRRSAEVLARARRQQAILAAVPLAVLLVFCLLLGVGALDGPAAVTLAWATLGALATGLACELPMRAREAGVLRRERFTGLSVGAFLAAKAALLLPALALADLLILAVPASANRLQAGFWLSYVMVFAASAVGLTAATATLFRAWRPSSSPSRRP